MINAAPRDIRDVQQTVDTTEVDECTVVRDILDHTVQDLAFLQAGDEFGALFGAAFFQDGPARDDDIAARTVHLENLERLRGTHQRGNVADRPDVDLTAWQESDRALQVDGETAFDPAEDDAVHAFRLLEGFFQLCPGFLTARFLARQNGLAALIFHTL